MCQFPRWFCGFVSPRTTWVWHLLYLRSMENNATDMATQTFNIWENIEAWDDVMGQMCAFVNDTFADIDMAYDWVCEMMNISSFVDNEIAWNSFYNTWADCDNRNDLTEWHVVD